MDTQLKFHKMKLKNFKDLKIFHKNRSILTQCFFITQPPYIYSIHSGSSKRKLFTPHTLGFLFRPNHHFNPTILIGFVNYFVNLNLFLPRKNVCWKEKFVLSSYSFCFFYFILNELFQQLISTFFSSLTYRRKK